MAKSRNCLWFLIPLIIGCFFAGPAFGGFSRGDIALAAQTVIESDVLNSPIVISDEFTPLETAGVQSDPLSLTGFTGSGESSFMTASITTPPTGGSLVASDEQSFKTLAEPVIPIGSLVLSDESSFKTLPSEPPPVVPPGDGGGGGGGSSGGGGGGGGSGGGRRISPPLAPTPLPVTGCSLYLKKFIKFGENNDPVEVRKLQLFLRDYMELEVPISGFYDEITFEAVKIFQLRYAKDILTPWGINYPTGYVYITTTLAINNLYCERDPANNLDLRSQFPTAPNNLPTLESTTTPPDILPDVGIADPPVGGWQIAAIGLLDFIRGHPWWWLIFVAILILIILLAPARKK